MMEAESAARPRLTRQALVAWHQQQAQRPIAVADDAGAFPGPFLPFVFPLVVDANVIRDELVRMARTGTRTIMANAASYGVLRLYCARHVVSEIAWHRDEWAHDAGLDPQLVGTVWRDTHMRLLRWVEMPPDTLYTPTEFERLRVLATPGSGDPDDLPTAALALLLGAPLLSKDRKAVAAVYGEIDYSLHVRWLDALGAGGDLGPLGQVLQATVLLGGGLGVAGVHAVRSLLGTIPGPWLLLLASLGAAGYVRLVPTETKEKIASGVMAASRVAFEIVGDLCMNFGEAQAQFKELAAPSCDPASFGEALTAEAALTRACLFHLARQPRSHVSASELREFFRYRINFPSGEQKVRTALRRNPCFVEVYRGRFQVGCSLARAAGSGERST